MSAEKAAATLDEQLREACASLDGRLRAGKKVRTEDILAELPELTARPEFILELAYTEFVARDALGETPSEEEWFERFPGLRQDLRELFEVHRFVEQSAVETLAPHKNVTDVAQRVETVASADEEPDADRRFGNYELMEEIGRGGMGVVYKARQLGLRRIVALKLILAGEHAGPERHERFQAEAETVARLSHPNIVQIHEVGAEQGRPFLSLEYVDGGGLDRRRLGEPWPPLEAAALAMTLARAMHYAHQQGIVHRDLKPANVLMTADGVPKITDFGLAKRLFEEQSGQTASGAMLGTPSYMAPEQALGNSRDSGVAADVYALGAILYELLTGRPPFLGASLWETLEQVRTQEPVGPRQLIGKLPRDLETICLKCLQKQPHHRYATADALADDLQRYLEHRLIQARPVNVGERVVRWSVRNPLLATLAASLALLIATALVVGPLVAYKQAALRKEVQRQLVSTKASLLAARSRMAADDAPQRSVLLAIEGIEALRADGQTPSATNEQALRDALARTSGVGLAGHKGALTTVAFAPDGKSLFTSGADGTVRGWPTDSSRSTVMLAAHHGPVRALAISASGRWMVTGGDDAVARVWDLTAPDIAATAVELDGFRGPLTVVTISSDDRWIFAGDRTGAGKLYSMSGPTPSLKAEVDVKLPMIAAAFSPDGDWLAVGAADNAAHVWPMENEGLGAEIVCSGHEGAVTAVAFDPLQPRLATASADRTVRVWTLPSAIEPTVLAEHGNYVSGVAFSPDGRWLVSGSFDGTARRYDLSRTDWPSASAVLSGHSDRVFTLAISADSRWLATAGRDQSVRVWDLTAENSSATARTLRGHDEVVHAVAFDRDTQHIVSASADGTARRYDLRAGLPTAAAAKTYRHGATKIQGLAVSPSGRWMASCGNDAVVRVWDREMQREFAALPHSSAVRFAEFSADDRWLVTVEMAAEPRPSLLWDLQSRPEVMKPRELRGHTQSVECLAIDPKSRWVVTGSLWKDGQHPEDGTVRRWALAGSDVGEGEVLTRHNADVGSLAIDRDGAELKSIDAGGVAHFRPLADSETKATEIAFPELAAGVRDFAAFPNGQRFVAVDLAGVLRIWTPLTASGAAPVASILWDRKPAARQVAVGDDGACLAALDEAGRVLIWRFEGEQLEMPATNEPAMALSGTQARGDVQGCAISDDHRWLCTFAKDGLVRVWSLDAPERAPILLEAHRGQAQAARFAPDHRTLITAGYDGLVREWPLEMDDLVAHARHVAGRALTEAEKQ